MASQPDPSPYFSKITASPLADAFSDDRLAHQSNASLPVNAADKEKVWQNCLNTARTAPGMAYVLIPFCENHCLFCGFYQNPWRPDAGAPYVDLVLKQATTLSGKRVLEGPPLRVLYFGGGKPTALAAEDIGRLVSGLRDRLPRAVLDNPHYPNGAHFQKLELEDGYKIEIEGYSPDIRSFKAEFRHDVKLLAMKKEE